MRIAFLCASLEPGRDGVGDYTIGLGEEIRRQSHTVAVIALADTFIQEFVSMNPGLDGGLIQFLRLPANQPWSERIERATQFLDQFKPEWVSLQFVCYGYHPKGIIYGLAEKLAPLFKSRKRHIMFHETWLCKELGFGWRQRVVGALQLHFIRGLVAAVKPDVIHTSNPTYVALLNRCGIRATELGLFGNVPVLETANSQWIESEMRTALGNSYRRNAALLFGLFGGLHSEWPPEPLLSCLRHASIEARKKPVLLSIGRVGEEGIELWNRMTRRYSDSFGFVRLGEQPAARISEYLSYLDCGIATTPRSIIGKSGSVIAMLEHGLPVIVNRDDASYAGLLPQLGDPLLISCDRNLEKRLVASIKKGPRGSRCPQVARDFVRDLERAKSAASSAPVCCYQSVDPVPPNFS